MSSRQRRLVERQKEAWLLAGQDKSAKASTEGDDGSISSDDTSPAELKVSSNPYELLEGAPQDDSASEKVTSVYSSQRGETEI